MNYIIYDWNGNSRDKLNSLGFFEGEGSSYLPKPNQDIWEAAKFIYENELNVMIRHGKNLDILCVSKGTFGQR
jgi:hypothetical protein